MDLRRAAWKVFSIHRGELGFVLPLFLLYFLSGSFYNIGQIYTETLFLKTYGAQGLSRFFIYNGAAIILAGVLYNYILLKLSLRKGYVFMIVLFSLLIAYAALYVDPGHRGLPFYLYLANYLFTFFLDIHFFNYVFQFMTIRNSKRILPFLMGGGKFGGMLSSAFIFTVYAKDISRFGIAVWAINGAALLLPLLLLRWSAKSIDAADGRASVPGTELLPDTRLLERIVRKARLSYSSPIFAWSVLAVFVMSVANQVSEYYFSGIFTRSFASKEALASFLSVYTLGADFLTLLLQLTMVSRLIRGAGVRGANYAYPLSFFSLICLLAAFPHLLAGVLLRFFRKNLSAIIRTPVFNIIMAASPRDRMAEVKSFISGIVSPLGMVAGGGIILLVSRRPAPADGYLLSAVIGIVFLALTFMQNRAYISTLKRRLVHDTTRYAGDRPDSSDFARLLADRDLLEKNLQVAEALFNENPSLEFLAVLHPHFYRLSRKTKVNILDVLSTAAAPASSPVVPLALYDADPEVRGAALALINNFPYRDRRELLFEYPPTDLEAEAVAVDLLLSSGGRTPRGADADALALRSILEIKREVREGRGRPMEFLMLVRVLPPSYYLPHLAELALETGNLSLFRALIPHAGKLEGGAARRLLYAFRNAPEDLLAGFAETAAGLREMHRAVLLDYRDHISEEGMERIFRRDERTAVIITGRLFRDRSYQSKSHYLNCLLSMGVRPEQELARFINGEIRKIANLVNLKSCLLGMEAETSRVRRVPLRFLALAVDDMREQRKHLILKAIAIRTGLRIDEVYDSSLLLKDRDLNNYILEYIESAGRDARQIVPLFEGSPFSAVTITPKELLRITGETEHDARNFLPAISGMLALCFSRMKDGRAWSISSKEKKIMLSLMEKIVFLKENRLFRELPVHEIVPIARITREIEVPRNRVIIREGNAGDELYILVDGEVEVSARKKTLDRLGPGSCIGELSIIDTEPRSATVRTLKKTALLAIRRKDFLLTLKENPSMAINITQVVTERLRKLISER